jgi:hypothetical protein
VYDLVLKFTMTCNKGCVLATTKGMHDLSLCWHKWLVESWIFATFLLRPWFLNVQSEKNTLMLCIIGNCRTNFHLTWKSRVDIKYISFSSQNNDFLQIREISQYPRPVQGQVHIRVKKHIWKKFNCIENIFFCKDIVPILKCLGEKHRSLGSFLRYVRKCTLYWKTHQWDWSIFGKLASSHPDLDGSIRIENSHNSYPMCVSLS